MMASTPRQSDHEWTVTSGAASGFGPDRPAAAAVALLDEDALSAVLAHERHHAHRHDPLRLAVGRVLAHALFFLPKLGDLVERQQALAELSADESAVSGADADRSALARAMLSFSESGASGGSTGIDPARVDYLLGEPPNWRFPVLLCLAAICILVLLVAVAVLAGHVASGSATLALPFLSRQPCIVVLAAIPAVLGVAATHHRRRLPVRSGLTRAPQAELLDRAASGPPEPRGDAAGTPRHDAHRGRRWEPPGRGAEALRPMDVRDLRHQRSVR
jgi:hypothetical protein